MNFATSIYIYPFYISIFLGGAVITVPPLNTNKTEGDMVNFKCKGEGTPGTALYCTALMYYTVVILHSS